ncbi:MAG: hypothetical protein ACPIOQ_45250 [Promethearchaeia archaeon]
MHFTELKITKAELMEEFSEAKKKLRRIQRSQELQDQVCERECMCVCV